MEQVKESLKNAKELVVYLNYYNRYLEDLKKSFMQGRNVKYNSFEDLHEFSNRIHTSKSLKCELTTTLSICNVDNSIFCGGYNYILILTLNCSKDDRSPVVSISNSFRLEELGNQKYRLYIFEEKQYKDVGWKDSTKIAGRDISELIEENQDCFSFFEKFRKNLLFFQSEAKKSA